MKKGLGKTLVIGAAALTTLVATVKIVRKVKYKKIMKDIEKSENEYEEETTEKNYTTIYEVPLNEIDKPEEISREKVYTK